MRFGYVGSNPTYYVHGFLPFLETMLPAARIDFGESLGELRRTAGERELVDHYDAVLFDVHGFLDPDDLRLEEAADRAAMLGQVRKSGVPVGLVIDNTPTMLEVRYCEELDLVPLVLHRETEHLDDRHGHFKRFTDEI